MTDLYSEWRDFYAEKVRSWMSLEELRAECGKLQTVDSRNPEVLLVHAMHALEELQAEVERVTCENEAMKRCAIRYLEWLGVTHVSLDQALYEDMHNPDMCGDAALTGHHNEVSND